MFYAIEYAYGSTVTNSGPRADKVYAFTRRALRDAWVADGNPDVSASGHRAAAKSRDTLVRRALVEAYDGDREAYALLARQRVDGSPALARYRDVILDDWADTDHPKWVATAPEREVIAWARDTAAARAD